MVPQWFRLEQSHQNPNFVRMGVCVGHQDSSHTSCGPLLMAKWTRRESNPCPKENSLSFYECSLFFDIPSAPRE